MNLVFLYGAPGVGKLTVAGELAVLTGYKIFHNHLTIDLVGSLFAFGSERAGRLTTRFRLEMFREAAREPAQHHLHVCLRAGRRRSIRPADPRRG